MPLNPTILPALLMLAALPLPARLVAENVVVFARGESVSLGSATPEAPKDPARAAFLAEAQKDLSGHGQFDAEFPLINPPDWGRTVSAATMGGLRIRRSFPGGLVFDLELKSLLPGRPYVLCINGRPDHPGNELLPESVPGHEAEKFYDFCTVTTDARGGYHGGFALMLRSGAYNVHFYVKDPADFKIVLYGLEYFDFTVK